MSYSVTVRKTDGTIVNTSTSAYGSARPNVDAANEFVKLTVSGVTAWYTVRWVSWETDPLSGGPKVTIGAALPSDPPPPPPA